MEEAECEMVCVKNFQKYFFVFFRRRRRRKVVSFFFSSSSSLLRIHPALLFSRGFRRGAPRREERERERERPKATKSSASVVVYVVVLFERAALKKELFSRSSSELY